MGIDDLEWRLIPEERRQGPVQMAFDEVAAETAGSGGPATVRVYRWEPSTLSLGYHQEVETIDREFCERKGIDITRRQTGGGGIYHDFFGDISYSIVVPAASVPGDLLDSYRLLLSPVLSALNSMDVPADLAEAERPPAYEPACYLRSVNPAHDVVVGGRKVSGNAQYRQKDAVIQHGSITYAREIDRHLAVFDHPVSPTVFEERITSIRAEAGIEREAAVRKLENALAGWSGADEGAWTDEEVKRAQNLAVEKYGDEEWITGY